MSRLIGKALFASIALAFLFGSTSVTHAQGNRPSRYTPSRPTVSPYLNLLNTNQGPLPNYYTYVRPQLQQNRINQEQSTALRQQQMELNKLEGGMMKFRQSETRPTGTGATFMNHGRYFGSGAGGGGAAGGAGRGRTR